MPIKEKKPSQVSILSPERGRNSRELVCPRCGDKSGEVDLGLRDFAGLCEACNTFNIGLRSSTDPCGSCGSGDIEPKRVPPNEMLPCLCDECGKELDFQKAIIRKGGVFWECKDCSHTGTMESTHPIAKIVRQETSEVLCGALLDKTSCPVCTETRH